VVAAIRQHDSTAARQQSDSTAVRQQGDCMHCVEPEDGSWHPQQLKRTIRSISSQSFGASPHNHSEHLLTIIWSISSQAFGASPHLARRPPPPVLTATPPPPVPHADPALPYRMPLAPGGEDPTDRWPLAVPVRIQRT
jgi:hypothetical protein